MPAFLAAEPVSATGSSPSEVTTPASTIELFWYGIAAKEHGRLDVAATAFRLILSREPGHFPARRALADLLIQMGEITAAEFHLKTLLSTDPEVGKHEIYQRILGELTALKPLRFTGIFALAPSTNVNQGTRNTVFDSNIGEFVISESGRETAGFGIRLGGNTSYSWPIAPGQKISLLGEVSAVWYEMPELRHVDGEFRLSYHAETPSANLEIGPYYRRTWYLPSDSGQISDMDAYGVALSYVRKISNVDTVGLYARFEEQVFFEKTYLSGFYQSVKVQWLHSVSADTQVYFTVGAQAYRPEAEHQAYDDFGLDVGLSQKLGDDWIIGLNAGIGLRSFAANYPVLSFPREDSYYTVGASVQNNSIRIFGNIPKLSCTFRDNQSNVAFFEYQSTDCQISISQSF